MKRFQNPVDVAKARIKHLNENLIPGATGYTLQTYLAMRSEAEKVVADYTTRATENRRVALGGRRQGWR